MSAKKKIDAAPSRRTAWGARAAAALVALLLLALAAGGVRGASAKEAPAWHGRTILVLPFDLYDYSLDQRPATVVPLRRWASRLADHVAANLSHGGSLRTLGGAKAVAALRRVRTDYPHPTACRACMISIARRTGAAVVVIGQVHKLSNLITYFDVQVDDVRTGRVLQVINMRADGADTDDMWKHIARNLAHRVDRAAAVGR